MAAAVYPRLVDLLPQTNRPALRAASPRQAVAAICRLLADAAERTPLLLLLDDLPRVQPEARSLVAQIAAALNDAPMAFLATARTDDDSLRDRALASLLDLHLIRRIEVKPLGEAALGDLIQNEYGAAIVPRLLPWLHAKSLGNPLFATELLRALESQGFLRNGNGTWRLNGRLEALTIPHTIGHLLEARRRRLPAHLAELLPILALLGPDAPATVLATASDLDEKAVAAQCERLAGLGFLERSGDSYVFAHPLMAEEYRARLNKQQQRDVAGRALKVIVADIATRPSYRPALRDGASDSGLETALSAEIRRILSYAEAEGNTVLSSLTSLELGRRSFDGHRPREAAGWSRYATQRMARVASLHERHWIRAQIDVLIGTALYQAGRMSAARRRLLRAVSSHEHLGLENKRKAFTFLGLLYCKTSRYSDARATFESACEIFDGMELSPDQQATIQCGFLNHLAWNELRRSDFQAAERYINRAESLLGDTPPERAGRPLVQLLTYRGLLRSGRGEYAGAVAELERAAEIARLHLPHALKNAEGNLALALVHVGDLRRARQIATRILRLETGSDDGPGQVGTLICLGSIAEAAAEWTEAAKAYERSLELAEHFGNFNATLSALAGLIATYEAVGDSCKSDHTWTRAVTMRQRILPVPQQGSLFLSRATALAQRGDWAGVLDIAGAWIPKLTAFHCRREAAALEILGIRAELEQLKQADASPAHPAESPAPLQALGRRLSALEEYLRREGLRGLLVESGQLQLHLSLAGLQGMPIDAVLTELVEHLRFMGATARLSEIAEEFSGTAVRDRLIFRQLFEPARNVASLRSETSSTPSSISSRSDAATPEIDVEPIDPRTRIFAFGALRIIPAGSSQTLIRARWASRRVRVLLACLLAKDLEGRGVMRDQIWDAVWPDADSFDLTNAFNISVTRLRTALRRGHSSPDMNPILYSDGSYRLAHDGIWCDAREFQREIYRAEKLAREGNHTESLRARHAAFDLYAGDFLADSDEIWAEPRRERYRTRFLESGAVLVEAALGEGRTRDAERVAEKVLACDPQGEEGRHLLTLVHSGAVRR
jgi:DNA-binding SARP family transcriptional activator/tetratricopeptide (TPR) repeat protein